MLASFVGAGSTLGISAEFDGLALFLVLEPLSVDLVLVHIWASIELIVALVEDAAILSDCEAIRGLLVKIALELVGSVVVESDNTSSIVAVKDTAVVVCVRSWRVAAIDTVLPILELAHNTIDPFARFDLEGAFS